MTWTTLHHGAPMKPTSEVEELIYWKSPMVVLVRVCATGEVHSACTIGGKRSILEAVTPDDLLLVGWPGQYRQDMFVVDNRAALSDGLAPSA